MLLTQPRPCWQKHVRVRVVAVRGTGGFVDDSLRHTDKPLAILPSAPVYLCREGRGISSHMAVPAAARRALLARPPLCADVT